MFTVHPAANEALQVFTVNGMTVIGIGLENSRGATPMVLEQDLDTPETATLWAYDEAEPGNSRHVSSHQLTGPEGRSMLEIAREALADL